MTTHELLTHLVEIAPPLINRRAKPGPHCVMATSIGQMVLAELGVLAEPYPVHLKVVNQAWLEWEDAGYPGGLEEQQRRGAYILSNTPNWQGPSFRTVVSEHPWDGHLVLRVPDGAHTWLVDLDLGAFNRPARRIVLPLGVVAPLTDGVVFGTFVDDDGDSRTAVSYASLDAPYRNDYLTAKDWTRRVRFLDTVNAILQALPQVYSA